VRAGDAPHWVQKQFGCQDFNLGRLIAISFSTIGNDGDFRNNWVGRYEKGRTDNGKRAWMDHNIAEM
jgi:hypothetical protein